MIGLRRIAFEQMLHTEMNQIVYRSSGVRNRLAELDLSVPGDRRRFASALIASGQASTHLTQWLTNYRERK